MKASPVPAFKGMELNILEIRAFERDIWIGTHGNGLIRHTPDHTIFLKDEGLFPLASVNEILQISNGHLVVATIQSIFLLEPSSYAYVEIELDIESYAMPPDILEIFEDSNGNIWLGTEGEGLFVLHKNSLRLEIPIAKKYLFDSFLDQSAITNICETETGEFWVSSENRVVRFFPNKTGFSIYDSNDGLPEVDIATGSSLCSKSGDLFFGSPQGYSRISNYSEAPKRPSRVSIVEAHAAGNRLAPSSPLLNVQRVKLTSLEFPLSVRAAVSEYRNPKNLQFRFRLRGHEDHWVYNGDEDTLNIAHLPIGDHILLIQAANSHGIWNQEGATLEITILPPPWQTWWAYTLYLAALVGSLWTIHRIYYSYIVERRSEELTIEIEETRNRAEDEIQEQLEYHDELAQAAHEHHGSILKLLRHCLRETLPEYEGEFIADSAEDSPNYVKALSLLENCTIYDEGDVSIDLAVFVEKLFPAIMPHCQVDPDTIITVNEVKDDPFTLEVGTTLAVIVYELAVNALSHAYADDSPANYLRVISRTEYSKETERETLSITVRDSGEGFPENAIETAPPGSGIALVQSLADNIGAEFSYSYRKGTMAKVTLEVSESLSIFA